MLYDSIHTVEVDSDEEGWILHLYGLEDDYQLRIHGVASELLEQFQEKVLPWWAEGEEARNSMKPFDRETGDEAYEERSPKRSTHLRVISGNS